jgi:hypothetical protein
VSSWLWLTLETASASRALAWASLTWPDGRRDVLAAWAAGSRPRADARRVDAALIDPGGPAVPAVVQWLPTGREPLFDDPAVQQALRRFTAFPAGPVSTLTRDATRYCGAVQVLTGDVADAADSPLRALGPAPLCRVGSGLLAVRGRPLHGTQRRGGAPWPAPA